MSEPRTLAWESANQQLIYEKQGPIAFFTLNRPEKINAMNREIFEGIAQCMADYRADDQLRCAIISGAGGNFSSGGDLKEMDAYLQAAKAEGKVHVYDAPHLRAMDQTYKPIIAALDGYCLAQAMFLAVLFCDIRIATPRVTMFSPPRAHTSHRLDPHWGSNLFSGTVGMPLWWYMGFGNLMYMSLVKKQLGAEEALRWGLINEIVPADQLMDRAVELAKLISESSPVGVRVSKEFYRKNLQAVNGYDLDLRNALFRSATAGLMPGGAAARKFRFGVGLGSSPEEWPSFARKAQDLGFATLYVGDHFAGNAHRLAPLPALVAAAAATSTIRLGTIVLANDFRHPAVLAKEAATVDLLSNGRFELGLGTGWLRDDYRVAGLPFRSPGERLERLAESVQICKAFFTQETITFRGKHFQIDGLDGFPKPVQRPHPPIMLGGRQRRMLSLAAREADIVSISRVEPGPGQPRAATFAENVDWIRAAAGPRYDTIELHTNTNVEVDDNQQAAIERLAARLNMPPALVLQAPGRLAGSPTAIVEQLLAWRERLDVSYITVGQQVMDALAPVVARLAGS